MIWNRFMDFCTFTFSIAQSGNWVDASRSELPPGSPRHPGGPGPFSPFNSQHHSPWSTIPGDGGPQHWDGSTCTESFLPHSPRSCSPSSFLPVRGLLSSLQQAHWLPASIPFGMCLVGHSHRCPFVLPMAWGPPLPELAPTPIIAKCPAW